ncbi:hypothetical protein [Microbacterium sp.]|uniref:hypothetical protein n=1 Tax=Microbacterium sp. TaxID=51671 RepID=UPI003C754575
MSDKKAKKRAELAVAAEQIAAERQVEDALKAIALRRTGHPWGQIARTLGRSQVEVEELAKIGYEHLLGMQDPDVLRAEVEDRLDAIIRAANVELATVETFAERNAAMRTIMTAERDRVRLLGLALKPEKEGDDDA